MFFSAIALLKFAITVAGDVGGINVERPDVGSSGSLVEKSEHEDRRIAVSVIMV